MTVIIGVANAQVCGMLLHLYMLSAPLVIGAYIQTPALGTMLATLSVLGLFALNKTAEELEGASAWATTSTHLMLGGTCDVQGDVCERRTRFLLLDLQAVGALYGIRKACMFGMYVPDIFDAQERLLALGQGLPTGPKDDCLGRRYGEVSMAMLAPRTNSIFDRPQQSLYRLPVDMDGAQNRIRLWVGVWRDATTND